MNKDLIRRAIYWQQMAAASYMISLSYRAEGKVEHEIWWQVQAAVDAKLAWAYLARLIGVED